MRRMLPAALLALLACNTLPVGYDELGRYPETRELVLLPDTLACYGRHAALGAADRLYLGGDDDYRARSLIRFNLPETLNLDSVLSIQLILHPVDTARTDSFHFICRPCSVGWDEASVSWVMATEDGQWFTRGGDCWSTVLSSGTLTGDSAVFELPYAPLDTALRTAVRENGLMLFPGSADTGFFAIWSSEAASGYRPRTKVTLIDSTSLYYEASDDATLADTMTGAVHAYDLTVGSGFALRTWARFSLDSIPREATIASAELSFRPGTQYRRSDSLGLGIRRLTERFYSHGNNPGLAAAATSAYYVVPADLDTVVTFDARSIVQFWTANRDSLGRDTANFGLAITPEPLWAQFFRLRIPGEGQHLPTLTVRYVMPPQDRFR